MPQTFLIFEFRTDEESAQRARQRLESWKQAYRLGNKVQFKFERQADSTVSGEDKGSKPNSSGNREDAKEREAADGGEKAIRLLIRLDFSAHEKHLHRSWVERISGEELFKTAKSRRIERNAAEFEDTEELFSELA